MRLNSTRPINWLLMMAIIITTPTVYGQASLRAETLTQVPNIPWGMTFVSDGDLLVTQKNGDILRINTYTGHTITIAGGPMVALRGQGGLMDVAIGPNFSKDNWVYFTYAVEDNGLVTTALGRAQLQDKAVQLSNWQTLLITKAHSNKGQHFGSRIAFDSDGHVFFSIGDRGERQNAQNTLNHAGSILRLTLDGNVPKDNPFVGKDGFLPEIWSYGHRNPQGIVYDHTQQTLWSVEHGPRGGDELNRIVKGGNYGWPILSNGKEYWGPIAVGEDTERAGYESPIKVYVPSIAPSFLLQYRGEAISEWEGDFLMGALVKQHLNRVQVTSNGELKETRYLENKEQRIRSGAVRADGVLFLGTDRGDILRLTLQ